MRAMKSVAAVLLVGLLIGFAGCAKAPEEAVVATQTSIDAARTAGAETYASEALAKANATFQQAKAEIEVQNGKFALLRSYKNAEALLTQAQTEGQQAQQAAVEGKERARQEANTAIDAARAALQATNELFAQVPKPRKDPDKMSYEQLSAELSGLQVSLDEASAAMASEEYINAKTKADLVVQTANAKQAELQAVVNKVK